MKFQKAEVELILFDNSDVIVTSPGDLPCEEQLSIAFCTDQGNSAKPNKCEVYVGRTCDASLDFFFFNSPGPGNPVDI